MPDRHLRRMLGAILVAALLTGAVPALPVAGGRTIPVRAGEIAIAVDGTRTVELSFAASHVAIYWRGAHDAEVRVALGDTNGSFGQPFRVVHDEVGEQRGNGITYGQVTPAGGARFARLTSDRPIGRLWVLALDSGSPGGALVSFGAGTAAAAVEQPGVISRSAWGADESLRYQPDGSETWPRTFFPIQKLILHHTATRNADPDPAATVRSIYYYHAITQGWGDVGYNFLIDEQGRIYEGRYSRQYAAGESPTGEDTAGNGVVGAHVAGYNSGTMGVALLGTLTNLDATSAARDALERLLAWKAERHAIDPLGSSLYSNPVNGSQRTFANISGHRDLAATECPGGTFYTTFPSLRQAVASRIAGGPVATVPEAPLLSASVRKGSVSLVWSVPADGGSAITGYRIYRATGKGATVLLAQVAGSTTSYVDRAVKRGKKYTYTLRAVNGVGAGPSSNAVKVTAR